METEGTLLQTTLKLGNADVVEKDSKKQNNDRNYNEM